MAEGEAKQAIRETESGQSQNQRFSGDRRRKVLPPLRYIIAGGRRRTVRRSEDSRRIVLLDRYSPKLFAIILGILVLSLLDAVLTLYLIEHGSNVLNPVVGFLFLFPIRSK